MPHQRAASSPNRFDTVSSIGVVCCLTQQLLHRRERRQPAVGAAALVGHLGGVLVPTHAGIADDVRVGHVHVVERDLVEVVTPVKEWDRVDLKARRAQIDEELRQPSVLVSVFHRARSAAGR